MGSSRSSRRSRLITSVSVSQGRSRETRTGTERWVAHIFCCVLFRKRHSLSPKILAQSRATRIRFRRLRPGQQAVRWPQVPARLGSFMHRIYIPCECKSNMLKFKCTRKELGSGRRIAWTASVLGPQLQLCSALQTLGTHCNDVGTASANWPYYTYDVGETHTSDGYPC